MPNVNSLVLATAILSRARFSKTPIDHAQTLCEIEKPKAASGRCLDGLPVDTKAGHRGSRDSCGKIDKSTKDVIGDRNRSVINILEFNFFLQGNHNLRYKLDFFLIISFLVSHFIKIEATTFCNVITIRM